MLGPHGMAHSAHDDALGRAAAEHPPARPLAALVDRTRYVVLIAVASVLVVAVALVLLGAVQSVIALAAAARGMAGGTVDNTDLSVAFLGIVGVMLKAVVFYLIGVGFYSLFIGPLNLSLALGVDTLHDLETKIVSVVVVILAVGFLERFTVDEADVRLLYRGLTLAAVVLALVAYQYLNFRLREADRRGDSHLQARAKQDLFERSRVHHRISETEKSEKGDRTAQSDSPA